MTPSSQKICPLQHSSFPEQQWKLYQKMRLIHRPNVTSYPFVKNKKCGNAIWTVSKNIILQSVYEANHMKICFILSVYLKCINNLISTKWTCIYFVRATEKLNKHILPYTNIWVFFFTQKTCLHLYSTWILETVVLYLFKMYLFKLCSSLN